MKKMLAFALTGTMCFSLAACSSSNSTSDDSSSSTGSKEATGTYSYNVGGYDWGAGVDKVTLKLSEKIDEVSKDTFTISETKQDTDWTKEDTPVVEVTNERTIEDAYLSDENGNKTEDPSEYVTFDLYVSPNDGNPLLYTMATGYNTWSNPYYLDINVAEGQKLTSDGVEIESLKVEQEATGKTTAADAYEIESFKASDGVEMEYGLYTPEKESKTLFVWLHGMGEGGKKVLDDATDPYVTELANKVTAYLGDDFQEAVGGANILVPQSPTFWLDQKGTGERDGTALKVESGDSFYSTSLAELIDKVKEDTKSDKVVIAGCSNGGYMTMRLAIDEGDKYDAYIPICEALADEYISDEDIETLKTLPLYFIYSKDDTTVDPAKYEEPTIKRLQDAGATDLVVWTPDHVVDTSGKYKDEDGNPYQYNGHWSWIYFDNNEANDEGQPTVWEWIGEQVK